MTRGTAIAELQTRLKNETDEDYKQALKLAIKALIDACWHPADGSCNPRQYRSVAVLVHGIKYDEESYMMAHWERERGWLIHECSDWIEGKDFEVFAWHEIPIYEEDER